MSNIYTTEEAAAELGLAARRVRELAVSTGSGTRKGAAWLFSDADLDRMRARNTRRGRPPMSREVTE